MGRRTGRRMGRPRTEIARHAVRGERKMKFRIRDIIGDLIGAISIFAIGYGLMLIGYGVGL
jgi:hypothetical protein